MADGSIIIKTDIDDKQAQNELNRLTKKIDSLNEKISDKKQQAIPLVEQSKQIAANLDEAKSKLSHMKSGNEFFTSSAIKDQEQTVETLQKEWNGVQKRVETMDASIGKDTRSLERMSNRAGEISAQIAGTSKSSTALAAASKKADKYMVEPYVVAADIYSNPEHPGRGGWTWYTGSSAWMYKIIEDYLK